MFGNDADDMRGPGRGVDPRAMVNDMSNDPIGYAVQRIELVNSKLKELPSTMKVQSWEEFENAYQTLFRESARSLQTTSRYVGGVYVNRSTPDQNSNQLPLIPVPKEVQKEAMSVMAKHAFAPDAFPITKELISVLQLERRGFDFSGEHEDPQIHRKMLSIQSSLLSHLLSGWTLDRISDSRLYGNTYSTQEMMNDLTNAIFLEDASSSVNTMRQNLQTLYTRRLIKLLSEGGSDQMSAAAAYRSLRDIEKIAKRRSSDPETQAHRDLLHWLIESALDRAQ